VFHAWLLAHGHALTGKPIARVVNALGFDATAAAAAPAIAARIGCCCKSMTRTTGNQ
jgi:hypothetical protein